MIPITTQQQQYNETRPKVLTTTAPMSLRPAAKVVHVQSSLPNIIRSNKQQQQQQSTPVETVTVAVPMLSSAPTLGTSGGGANRRKANMSNTKVEAHTEIIINGRKVEEADILKKADELRRQEEEINALLHPIPTSTIISPHKINGSIRLANSDIEFIRNELGVIEVSGEGKAAPDAMAETVAEEGGDDEDIDLTCKEALPISPPDDRPDVMHVRHFGRPQREDALLCCEGCGRYGMSGDFVDKQSCSQECQQRIKNKIREKEKRERELLVQKQRREAKRKERELQKQMREREESEARAAREAEVKRQQAEAKRAKAETARVERAKAKQEARDEAAQVQSNRQDQEAWNKSVYKYNMDYPWCDPYRGFCWPLYLEHTRSRPAPLSAFRDYFPSPVEATFKPGMKLEAVDPEHQALICVVTVAQVKGYRLRLHFDGFPSAFDFWEDVNSPNLYPVGFAKSQGQRLSPPPSVTNKFDWEEYLAATQADAAPRQCFPNRDKESPSLSCWKVGQKLEAVDRWNPHASFCAATVARVMEGRVLVHFDGWDQEYDYWIRPDGSPHVRPVGWCQDNGVPLTPPKGMEGSAFRWRDYMMSTCSLPVPLSAFTPAGDASLLRRGTKLEAVDKRNPGLVRVATVAETVGRTIRIHYDGWPDDYDVWVDDTSSLLHPQGWCARAGHPLSPPLTPEEVQHVQTENGNGCPLPGCNGEGRVSVADGVGWGCHSTAANCPYAPANLDSSMQPDTVRGDRITGERAELRISHTLSVTDTASTSSADPLLPPAVLDCLDKSDWSFATPSRNDSNISANSALGRGNRKRKKRKFFDEDEVDENNDNDDDSSSICSSSKKTKEASSRKIKNAQQGLFAIRHQQQSNVDEADVRRSVFQPGYDPDLDDGHSNSPQGHQPPCLNSVFLCQKLPSVTRRRFSSWLPGEVAQLVRTMLPYLGEQAAARLVEEEVDGEAFLMLTQADLIRSLGLKLGPALKLYNAIHLVKASLKD